MQSVWRLACTVGLYKNCCKVGAARVASQGLSQQTGWVQRHGSRHGSLLLLVLRPPWGGLHAEREGQLHGLPPLLLAVAVVRGGHPACTCKRSGATVLLKHNMRFPSSGTRDAPI